MICLMINDEKYVLYVQKNVLFGNQMFYMSIQLGNKFTNIFSCQ